MKYDITKLAQAINIASSEAQKFASMSDEGTCNFDTPYIYAKGMRELTARQISAMSGVICRISTPRLFGRLLLLYCTDGIGARRTAMAEAAARSLKERGIADCGVWYQMD